MSDERRKRVRDGHRDTIGGISRATATLSISCLSVVILNGVDDRVILGIGTVSTPFVGQTRYELFIILAPALITALRLYIDLQVAYLARLTAIGQRYNIRSSLALTAANTPILWIAGACAIHLAPPTTIVMIGYHASAAYPERGLVLYGWAAALLLWSVVLTFIVLRPSGATRAFAATSAAVIIGGVAAIANSNHVGFCERRYEGLGEKLSPAFLRLIELSRADLSAGSYDGVNFSCGLMEDARFHEADVRFAKFWWANLQGAEFVDSKFAYAEFHGAQMRQTDMSGAEGRFSQFIRSELDGSNLSNATLTNVRFNHAKLEIADLSDAKLESASFYKARLDDVNFQRAILSASKFYHAELFEIDFTGANLLKARFDDAEIFGARFDGANLRCSSFLGATLKDVDFSGVALEKLQGTQFPEPDEMTDVTWPDGYDREAAAKLPQEC